MLQWLNHGLHGKAIGMKEMRGAVHDANMAGPENQVSTLQCSVIFERISKCPFLHVRIAW